MNTLLVQVGLSQNEDFKERKQELVSFCSMLYAHYNLARNKMIICLILDLCSKKFYHLQEENATRQLRKIQAYYTLNPVVILVTGKGRLSVLTFTSFV